MELYITTPSCCHKEMTMTAKTMQTETLMGLLPVCIWSEVKLAPFILNKEKEVFSWINNHMHSKVCDEITVPFPNFNGHTPQVETFSVSKLCHFHKNVCSSVAHECCCPRTVNILNVEHFWWLYFAKRYWNQYKNYVMGKSLHLHYIARCSFSSMS